jgi:hypothetical protein
MSTRRASWSRSIRVQATGGRPCRGVRIPASSGAMTWSRMVSRAAMVRAAASGTCRSGCSPAPPAAALQRTEPPTTQGAILRALAAAPPAPCSSPPPTDRHAHDRRHYTQTSMPTSTQVSDPSVPTEIAYLRNSGWRQHRFIQHAPQDRPPGGRPAQTPAGRSTRTTPAGGGTAAYRPVPIRCDADGTQRAWICPDLVLPRRSTPRAEGSSEPYDRCSGLPTDRRSREHSRPAGCRRPGGHGC